MGRSLDQSGSKSTVDAIIKRAESFLKRHPNDAEIGRTYGYFTKHVVAPLNRKRLELILDELTVRSKKLGRTLRVLDLACGGGLITCAVATQGHRALGMDLDREEIRLARAFAQEEKLDGVFMQVDLLHDPDWEKRAEETLGGKPDVITLAYALHHLPEVEGFISRLSKWLEPPATLLINEENPQAPLFRLKHRVRTFLQNDTETEWHRTFDQWSTMLSQNGFAGVSEMQGADPMPFLAKHRPDRCWSLVFTATRG